MHAQDAARKPLVSVSKIEDLAKSGQADAFAKMIETAVTQTGKFRVFEDNHAILAEHQAKAAAGIITTRTPGKRGGFTGADFLIYGTITTASRSTKDDKAGTIQGGFMKDLGVALGRKTGLTSMGDAIGGNQRNCAKATASLAIDVKIVDGESGEIKYADSLNPTIDSRSSCTGDPVVDYRVLLRNAATQIAGALVTSSFPVRVVAVLPDGTVMLDYGVGTIRVGDTYTVFGTGEKILDFNGAVLSEGEGAALGNIRVVDVQAKFSKALPTGAFVSPPQRGMIARPAVASLNAKRGRK